MMSIADIEAIRDKNTEVLINLNKELTTPTNIAQLMTLMQNTTVIRLLCEILLSIRGSQ
jgi:hypothetical protein